MSQEHILISFEPQVKNCVEKSLTREISDVNSLRSSMELLFQLYILVVTLGIRNPGSFQQLREHSWPIYSHPYFGSVYADNLPVFTTNLPKTHSGGMLVGTILPSWQVAVFPPLLIRLDKQVRLITTARRIGSAGSVTTFLHVDSRVVHSFTESVCRVWLCPLHVVHWVQRTICPCRR